MLKRGFPSQAAHAALAGAPLSNTFAAVGYLTARNIQLAANSIA